MRQAIVDLAHGSLSALVDRDLAGLGDGLVENGDIVGLLWLELLLGIRNLAADLLGVAQEVASAPADAFARVRDISVEEIAFGNATRVLSTFAGPHHLASLLHTASADLRAAGVINVEAPPSIPSTEWRAFLQRMARTLAKAPAGADATS